MSPNRSGGSRQPELFPRSKCPTIPLAEEHPLVRLTDTLDWTALEGQAEAIRRKKLKSRAGRPPHLRALIGVIVLMGLRKRPLRESEDQVRYYAPARYLCGLTETQWTPDFTTIQDFEALMGDGLGAAGDADAAGPGQGGAADDLLRRGPQRAGQQDAAAAARS